MTAGVTTGQMCQTIISMSSVKGWNLTSASDIWLFHPLFVAYMFVFWRYKGVLDKEKQRMILVVCVFKKNTVQLSKFFLIALSSVYFVMNLEFSS